MTRARPRRTALLIGVSVIAISAGFHHSLVLCSDGTLISWGGGDEGQLGNNSRDDSHAGFCRLVLP